MMVGADYADERNAIATVNRPILVVYAVAVGVGFGMFPLCSGIAT